jgi:hypothetical protein
MKPNASQVENVSEQETRPKQHDAGLQPEFVSGHAGLKNARHANGVGNEQSNHDRPQDVFNVGKGDVVTLGIGRDGLFDDLPAIAHHGEQQEAGNERQCAADEAACGAQTDGASRGEAGGH